MPRPDGGGTKGIDDGMATYSRSLSANGVPVPQIAARNVRA
ncbi:hypothetical protein ACFYSF_40090 [Streptomyces canus]